MNIINLISLKSELENNIKRLQTEIPQLRTAIVDRKDKLKDKLRKQKKHCEMQISSNKSRIEDEKKHTLEYNNRCQNYEEKIEAERHIFVNYQKNSFDSLINHHENGNSDLNTIPAKALAPPDIIRIGEFHRVGTLTRNNMKLDDFPAIIPIRASSADSNIHQPGHIAIFSNDAASREAALAAIQSIALRAIATFPVLKLKGVFLDPVGMGNNFPFENLPEKIRGLKTYTRDDDIQEQLRSLNLHTEQVIQEYLGKNYNTIDDFNQKAYVKQAYHYLFAADFPTFFDNKSWEDLKSLIVNGARAGVYAVIHIDETLEKPRSFDYQVFYDRCTVVRPSGYQNRGVPLFTTALPNGLDNVIELDVPPSNKQFNQIAQIITKVAKNIKTENVPFQDLYPNPGEEWSFDSRKEIRTPIGIRGATKLLEFWMGKNDDDQVISNGLLAGKPGSGKSFTLHAIITSLAMRYSPEELEMYLLDFKEGIEFQTYVEPEKSKNKDFDEKLDQSNALPHAQVISVESDREFGLSVLEHIKEQITKRSKTFKEFGVENITEYRKKTGEKMPRILVLIDEYQSMFEENDEITTQLNTIFDTIVRKGRAYGIHLLLASQSPDVSNINRGIYNQIGLRMAQQMDKDTAASLLDAGNVDAVDLLDRPGKIILNRDFGRKSYNQVGQVANISDEERMKALKHIGLIAKGENYQRPRPLILFNGARLTKLDNNLKLEELSKKITENQRWLTSKELKDIVEERDWFAQEHPSIAWLGEAMRIDNHTRAIFRRRASSNMLLVGTSEETIFGILSGMLVSLVHCYQPKQAQFNIVDLSISDEENKWADMCQNFRDHFNSMFDIILGKRFLDSDKQIIEAEKILEETYEEFNKRKKAQDENSSELQSKPSMFFVFALGDLNRGQKIKLKSTMDDYGSNLSPNAEKLLEILSQGSELGIHTILWIDNLKTFKQLTAERIYPWLEHFAFRIGLRMSGADSQIFLNQVDGQNLGDLRGYLYDESTSSLNKFKPYEVLTNFSKYSNQLKQIQKYKEY